MASSGLLAASFAMQGVSSIGNSIVQSKSAQMQADFQKQQFDFNADSANRQAEDAIKRGDKEANQYRKNVKKVIGSQRAAMAAQGIEIDDGSALDVQMDTAAIGEQDAIQIKMNAYREAYGYRSQALDLSSRGNFAKLSAKNESRNTLISGGLSALGSGFSAAHYGSGGSKGKDDR